MIPGGFTFNQEGHATVIEVCRKENNCYDIHFINTGSGLLEFNKLRQAWAVLVSQETPAYVVRNMSIEELATSSFIPDILWANHGSFACSEEAEKAMLKPLSDMDKLRRLSLSDEKFAIQRNGTCAHDSFQGWLLMHLDKPAYNAFQYFSVHRGLKKLCALQALER